MTEGLYFSINLYFVDLHLSIEGNLTSNKNSSVSVCILDNLAVLNGSYRTFFQCIVNAEPRMFIPNYTLCTLSIAHNKSLLNWVLINTGNKSSWETQLRQMIKIGQSSAVYGLNWENLFCIVAYGKGYWNNPKVTEF